MLEALASGRPLLSSNVMPMPEFGDDAVVYFSPFDVKSIKDALVNVLENNEFAMTMGNKAKKQSLKYSWKKTSENTWDKIIQIVDIKSSQID